MTPFLRNDRAPEEEETIATVFEKSPVCLVFREGINGRRGGFLFEGGASGEKKRKREGGKRQDLLGDKAS